MVYRNTQIEVAFFSIVSINNSCVQRKIRLHFWQRRFTRRKVGIKTIVSYPLVLKIQPAEINIPPGIRRSKPKSQPVLTNYTFCKLYIIGKISRSIGAFLDSGHGMIVHQHSSNTKNVVIRIINIGDLVLKDLPVIRNRSRDVGTCRSYPLVFNIRYHSPVRIDAGCQCRVDIKRGREKLGELGILSITGSSYHQQHK